MKQKDMNKPKILVIDDDRVHLEGMVVLLEDEDYKVDEADSAEAALKLIYKNSYDLIITDYKMQKIDGMELLKMINDFDPMLKVIMVTGYSSIEDAVKAIHLGALDYIPKPVDPVKLKEVVRRALSVPVLKTDTGEIPERYIYFGEMVGKSRGMKQIVKKINEIANIDVSVLIYGESGTGKELVARALHNASSRKSGPFIAVNTGAIARDLISSELFGHEKGAFTGATDSKKGKFEEADGGTLFLDEISSMSEQVQIALLRVLETNQIERLGSNRTIPVNVRIVAATNVNLDDLIGEGKFREDLYYRLNVYNIELPPLRERQEDIPLIVDYYIDRFNRQYGKRIAGVDEEAMRCLSEYTWPGNIRELRNLVLRSMISAREVIKKKDLPEAVAKGTKPGQEIRIQAGTPLPDIERMSIIKTLQMARGNKLKAAEMLGISRRSLYNKLEEYNIDEEEYS
ncbi:MAG TPA: sigma-54-dependent Fis family transcriptional regulator [Caldithrix abyssi]|uniref:Sigma-54-dependent Fis family transcriptional regulator n=1 Tax=Caldithrix abyssi TaxID=187145 RepID=A0A7V4U486_CALAY|nr:sigma-54-dependent Fis family transcriptional regulator [Caldithrix abyssi]